MPLKLTSEFIGLLKGRVTTVEVDVPMAAMDTLHFDQCMKMIINPNSCGTYRVELWSADEKLRVMTVTEAALAVDSPIPSPSKFLSTNRI